MKKQLLLLGILFIFIGINSQSAIDVISSRCLLNSNIDVNNRQKTDFSIGTLWNGSIAQSGNDEYFPATQILEKLRALNNDSYLESLTITNIVLNPSFNRQIFNYTAVVGLDVETITINATPYDNASISENSDIGEKDIEIGSNEFIITVIAEDGITTQDYTITVIRKQIDATLSNLSVSIGEFTPEFDSDITEYYIYVDSNTDSITITAIPNDENSTVTGDGYIALAYGRNIIEISVLAEDSTTTKIYTLNIERDIIISPIPPTNGHSFSDTTLTFIPNGREEYIIKTLNIDRFEEGATISTLEDIERIFLNIEHSYLGDLSIYITCPNNQRCILKAYSSTIPGEVMDIATPGSIGGGNIHLGFSPDPQPERPCYLTSGAGMYYWFTSTGTNSFGREGPTTSIYYGDPCGNVETWQQLNSDEYGSYESFNSLLGCPVNGDWSITITDNLSADNGYLFEWGITFAEHFQQIISTDASLFNITVSEGELIPGFNPDIFEYTVNVEPDIETIEISATTSSRYATITEDSSIGLQNLDYGNNEFNITVVAEDSVTSLTYTIAVNRRILNNDATLSNLIVSQGELTPEFDPQTFEYNVYVEPDIRVIEITAITTDNLATIIDNNSTGEQGLDYGINIFPVGVLAEDLITTEIYRINAIRGYNSINNHEAITFAVYPNPAKNYINLNLSELKGNTTVQIINALGVVCYEQKLKGGIIHKISTVNFAKGIYFVFINDKVIKLVIE